jgi:type IV secretion system protein VirB5
MSNKLKGKSMSKKWLVVGLLFCGLANVAQAQIPVTDVAGLTQQIQQVVSWGQQLQQMKAQIDQQKATYEAMSGSRGLGNLMNNPTLKNTLPQDWQKVYSAVQQGGYQGLTSGAKAIRDANRVNDCVDRTTTLQALCQREANKSAQDKAFAQEAYAGAQARLDNIQGLMSQIDATTDAKSIAELNARMQAEQAMIQNEQTKLQMFRMLADAERDLIDQQKRETSMKDLQRPSKARDGSLSPVQF